MKNSPNFDATPRGKANVPITKSRRISFTTLSTNASPDVPANPTRRIKPTPVQSTSSQIKQQNKAFLDQRLIEESPKFASISEHVDKKSCLPEERELLR